MEKIAVAYNRFSTLFGSKYDQACKMLGVQDTVETRVFLAVVSGVVIFYACWLLGRVWSLAAGATGLLMAIVNQ